MYAGNSHLKGFTCILYISYIIMDAAAMTSADPVDMTAIRIKSTITYSPVLPRSLCATVGGTRPAKS